LRKWKTANHRAQRHGDHDQRRRRLHGPVRPDRDLRFLVCLYNWEDAYVNAGGDDVDRADDTYEFTAMSYYLQVGYNFRPGVRSAGEIILRYDYLDPDTMNDEEKHGDKDALTDIVGGVNYYIKGYNAMLSLNYIYHGEEWEEVGNLAATTPRTASRTTNSNCRRRLRSKFPSV
jgi:hypothetical protein